MKLEWSSVRAEHVRRACEVYLKGQHTLRARAKGIFLISGRQQLPAKQVLRLAYLIANNLDFSTPLRFTSGDGTIKLLRNLGFEVTRASDVREQRGSGSS